MKSRFTAYRERQKEERNLEIAERDRQIAQLVRQLDEAYSEIKRLQELNPGHISKPPRKRQPKNTEEERAKRWRMLHK